MKCSTSCYPAAILLLSCCYPAAILLLSCCYPAAILLLSWSPQLTLTTCALVIHHPEETYSYCFAAKQQWQCTRWYTWCISVKSGGTPDFTLHNRWYTYCGIAALAYANAAYHSRCYTCCWHKEKDQHSIANSNAAFSCIGVRSAAESCRSHKVRCLHLTVNSQWKMT